MGVAFEHVVVVMLENSTRRNVLANRYMPRRNDATAQPYWFLR